MVRDDEPEQSERRQDVGQDSHRGVVQGVDERGDEQPLDDDWAAVLGVELRQAEVEAGPRREDDMARPDDKSLCGNGGCRRPRSDARRFRRLNVRGGDVQQVLDCGEPDTGHGTVDDAVDDRLECPGSVRIHPDCQPLDDLLHRADDEEIEGDQPGNPRQVEKRPECGVDNPGKPRKQYREQKRCGKRQKWFAPCRVAVPEIASDTERRENRQDREAADERFLENNRPGDCHLREQEQQRDPDERDPPGGPERARQRDGNRIEPRSGLPGGDIVQVDPAGEGVFHRVVVDLGGRSRGAPSPPEATRRPPPAARATLPGPRDRFQRRVERRPVPMLVGRSVRRLVAPVSGRCRLWRPVPWPLGGVA